MSQSNKTSKSSPYRLSLNNPPANRLTLSKPPAATHSPGTHSPGLKPSGSRPPASNPPVSNPPVSNRVPQAPASSIPLVEGTKLFVLTFEGAPADFPEYRHTHRTFVAAEIEARRVLALLEGRPPHPPIIDGPGCGRDGRRLF